MKYIISFLFFILFGLLAIGQVGSPSPYSPSSWSRLGYLQADSGLVYPSGRDTNWTPRNAGTMIRSNGIKYVWDGLWKPETSSAIFNSANSYFDDGVAGVKTGIAYRTAEDILTGLTDPYTGEAVTYKKVTGVTDANIDGFIIRKKGTEYFKRNYTGFANIQWFGLVGDGVTDNYNAFHKVFTDSRLPTDVYIPKGTYFSSKSDSITRFIHLRGEEGYQIANPVTIFQYPKGVSGPVLNNNNTQGSIIEGLTFMNTAPTGGSVMEYNPDDSTLLSLVYVNLPVAGQAYEFYDPLFPQTIKGTATVSSITTGGFKFVQFKNLSGKFKVGDTLIAGSNRTTTALIKFVSKLYNLVYIGTETGSGFTAGDTIRGSASAATGNVTVVNYTNGTRTCWQLKLSNPSGTLNGLDVENRRITAFREANTYSVGLTLNRRAHLRNISIFNFGGDGVYNTSQTTPVTNANLTVLDNIRSNQNGGNGIRVEGGDGNLIKINNSTCVLNRGYGIVDLSFLGITVNTPHTELNMSGAYHSGSSINRKTTYINPYSEGGLIVDPYYPQESYVGGGSQSIGGTIGMPIRTDPLVSSGGALFDIENFQNNRVFTRTLPDGTKQSSFRSISGVNPAYPLAVEQSGFSAVGRGPGIEFRGPNTNGAYIPTQYGQQITAATTYGNENIAVSPNGTAFTHRVRLRRNVAPNITVTGTGGSGALLVPNFLNGSLTSVDVIVGGDNYPINATTATLPAPTSGTQATISVQVGDGHITSATIINAGTGYVNTDLADLFETTTDNLSFRPVTDNIGSLGDATHRFSNLYSFNPIFTGLAKINTDTLATLANLRAGNSSKPNLDSVLAAGNTSSRNATFQGVYIGQGSGNVAGNTAVGGIALNANTTGNHNTALGYGTLNPNVTGIENTAVGYLSSQASTGNYNTSVGSRALYNNTGDRNTSVGNIASYSNTTGYYNTSLGYYAGGDITTGAINTAIGYNTGLGITTGNYNTIIGSNITGLAPGLSNTVVIADGQGNKRIISNTTATTIPHLSGTNTRMVVADSSGNLSTQPISGAVTSVSVVSANGFSGTVATPTTTPAITINTTVSGIIKGSANAIVAASGGNDFALPITAVTGITAAGATQATATSLGGSNTIQQVTTVPLGSGVILPPASQYAQVTVTNRGVNTLLVYPYSTQTINNRASSIPYLLPVNATTTFSGLSTLAWQTSLSYTGGDVNNSDSSSALLLSTVNSNTGTFGSATTIPVLTVDGKGRVTSVSTAAISASSGTYTPTLTNTTNITSSSVNIVTWTKVGSVLHLNITGSITPTAATGATELTISLPFNSTNALSDIGFANIGLNSGTSYTSGQVTLMSASTIKLRFITSVSTTSSFQLTADYNF